MWKQHILIINIIDKTLRLRGIGVSFINNAHHISNNIKTHHHLQEGNAEMTVSVTLMSSYKFKGDLKYIPSFSVTKSDIHFNCGQVSNNKVNKGKSNSPETKAQKTNFSELWSELFFLFLFFSAFCNKLTSAGHILLCAVPRSEQSSFSQIHK